MSQTAFYHDENGYRMTMIHHNHFIRIVKCIKTGAELIESSPATGPEMWTIHATIDAAYAWVHRNDERGSAKILRALLAGKN